MRNASSSAMEGNGDGCSTEQKACGAEDQLHDLWSREVAFGDHHDVAWIDAECIGQWLCLTIRRDEVAFLQRARETGRSTSRSHVVDECKARVIRIRAGAEDRTFDDDAASLERNHQCVANAYWTVCRCIVLDEQRIEIDVVDGAVLVHQRCMRETGSR